MRSSLAKSIYVSAAVLGLAGLSAVTTTTTASANSSKALTAPKTVLPAPTQAGKPAPTQAGKPAPTSSR